MDVFLEDKVMNEYLSNKGFQKPVDVIMNNTPSMHDKLIKENDLAKKGFASVTGYLLHPERKRAND